MGSFSPGLDSRRQICYGFQEKGGEPVEKEYMDSLRQCALFYGIQLEKALEELPGPIQSYPKDFLRIQEGERVEDLHIVLKGTLRASKFTDDGGEFLYQNILPGYIAGAEVVCTPKKTSPYAVYAVTDCVLWSVPWACLEDDRLPVELRMALLKNLLYLVGNQNLRKFYKIDALSVRGVRARVWKYLNAQAERCGSKSFTVPFDREAMANYLCVNRSALSHELGLMEAEGLIRFHKDRFTIL